MLSHLPFHTFSLDATYNSGPSSFHPFKKNFFCLHVLPVMLRRTLPVHRSVRRYKNCDRELKFERFLQPLPFTFPAFWPASPCLFSRCNRGNLRSLAGSFYPSPKKKSPLPPFVACNVVKNTLHPCVCNLVTSVWVGPLSW